MLGRILIVGGSHHGQLPSHTQLSRTKSSSGQEQARARGTLRSLALFGQKRVQPKDTVKPILPEFTRKKPLRGLTGPPRLELKTTPTKRSGIN